MNDSISSRQLYLLRPDRRTVIPDIADPNLVRDPLLVFLGNLIDGMYFPKIELRRSSKTRFEWRDAVRARLHHRYDDIVMDRAISFQERSGPRFSSRLGSRSPIPPTGVDVEIFPLKLSRSIKAGAAPIFN